MKNSVLLSALLIGLLSAFARGGELRVSQLAVPAASIGTDWSGPTGLIVDDIDQPPATGDGSASVIAELRERMAPLGVKRAAEFTYHRKSDPSQQVSLRVFAFKTEAQCKQWMKTKYQFAGWEQKYRMLDEKDLVGFDSLEMRKRIVEMGSLWITAGTISDSDDYLKVLGLLLERIRQLGPQAEPTTAPGAAAESNSVSFPKYAFSVGLPKGWHTADADVLKTFSEAVAKGVVAHAQLEGAAVGAPLDSEFLLICCKHPFGANVDNPNVTISVERAWDGARDHSGDDYLHLLAKRFTLLNAPSTFEGEAKTLDISGTVFSAQEAVNKRVAGVPTRQEYIATYLDGYYLAFIIAYNNIDDADYGTMRAIVETFRR